MRKREEFAERGKTANQRTREKMMIEILLDIRDLLETNPQKGI